LKIIKNFALAMLLVWIFQLGFNSGVNLVKNFIFKNITVFYEDKSDNVLGAHRLFYGAIGLWAAGQNNKNLDQGLKNGELAGEIAYLGKKIARKRGLGFLGKMIHSLGVSMVENQILNKPLFSRYRTFVPPLSLELDIQEGFNGQILLGSVGGILANIFDISKVFNMVPGAEGIDRGYIAVLVASALIRREFLFQEAFSSHGTYDKLDISYYKPLDSLLAGTPVFNFKDEDAIMGMNGLNIGGVIAVNRDFYALPHEIVHSCQYREAAIVNLLIERRFFAGFPLLFSQDLISLLVGNLREEEPYEYDVIYFQYKE
jgi:hypothetical protein